MFPEGQGKRVPFARDGTAAEKTNELLVNAKDAINELHSLRPPAGRHAGPSRGPAGRPQLSSRPSGCRTHRAGTSTGGSRALRKVRDRLSASNPAPESPSCPPTTHGGSPLRPCARAQGRDGAAAGDVVHGHSSPSSQRSRRDRSPQDQAGVRVRRPAPFECLHFEAGGRLRECMPGGAADSAALSRTNRAA